MRKPKRNAVADRVAAYIAEHWKGNVTHAATALGCSYYHLYSIATDRVRKINHDCLKALVAHSGWSADYWLYGASK